MKPAQFEQNWKNRKKENRKTVTIFNNEI
jgi:hypothetical protein